MSEGDKVKSSKSLWCGDIGTIFSIVADSCVWVVFPENDKHYAYKQQFMKKDLQLIKTIEDENNNR